jgi:hypothetical protein
MTYAVGGLIEASDLNNFVSTGTPNVNAIWSTGSGNTGYGQTALTTVSVGDIIAANRWTSLTTTISNIANHTGATIGSMSIAAATGNLVTVISNIATNITTINNARANAVAQGTQSSNTKTNSATWSGTAPGPYTLTMTSNVTFESADKARFYFNAGGQTKVQVTHPANGEGTGQVNGFLNVLCSDVGTVSLSSVSGTATANIVGTVYTGTTKTGGGGTSTVATTIGFYSLSTTSQNVITQTNSAYADYGTSNIVIQANLSGNTINYTALFTLNDVDSSGSNPKPIAGTTLVTIAVPPSSGNIANTWGNTTFG